MSFLHQVIDRCECGHPVEVHWDGEAGRLWCSAPDCTCRRAGRGEVPLDPMLVAVPSSEMVRIVGRRKMRSARGVRPDRARREGHRTPNDFSLRH